MDVGRRHMDAPSDANVGAGVAELLRTNSTSGGTELAPRDAAVPPGNAPGNSPTDGGPEFEQATGVTPDLDTALRTVLEKALAQRYVVLRPIGIGGMGAVYLVLDKQHDRRLALKVLLPEVAAALGATNDAERFLREIRISAHLSHPHIVALYDSGQADGLLYYTMPYVPGESLRTRLRREGRVSLRDAIGLARQVASALDYAHRQGVIHRDVKPENILIHEGEALVADFGIARAVDAQRRGGSGDGVRYEPAISRPEGAPGATAGASGPAGLTSDDRLTITGLALGTPLYMSPEQAVGEPADERSDIYAMGCVVYEMLTGAPPFTDTNVNAILARKLALDLPRLSGRRGGLPPAVDDILRKALRPLPADRFTSGDEFVCALERAAGLSSEQPSVWTTRWFRGRRASVLSTATIVTLAAGIAVATRDRATTSDPPRIRAIAVLPLEVDSSHVTIADDIHARIVNELASVRSLRVAGIASSMRYRGSATPRTTVAKELNVDGLLESSLTVGHDSLALQLRLRRGVRGDLLWTHEYTVDMRHMQRLQKDVARDVVTYLQLPLTPDERRRLARYRVTNPRANDAYQRGRVMSASYDVNRFRKSIAAFEEAIRLDPEDPAAYVALAEVYQTMVGAGHVQPDTMTPAVAFGRAKELIQRALELDPDNAEAHVILGGIRHMWDWDWKGADQAFVHAIRNSPGAAPAHFQYGAFLQSIGSIDSAVAELRRAARLDPLSPMILGQLAWAHIWAGRPDSALYWTRMALDLEPNLGPVLWVRGMAFTAAGQHDSAIATHARVQGDRVWRLGLALAYMAAGRRRDFERTVATLPDRAKRWAAARASRFTGDRDAAIRAFEREIDEHMSWIAQIRGDPAYAHLATDPRYRALLTRLGLPQWPSAGEARGATTPSR